VGELEIIDDNSGGTGTSTKPLIPALNPDEISFRGMNQLMIEIRIETKELSFVHDRKLHFGTERHESGLNQRNDFRFSGFKNNSFEKLVVRFASFEQGFRSRNIGSLIR
jgi:hypothetical protein